MKASFNHGNPRASYADFGYWRVFKRIIRTSSSEWNESCCRKLKASRRILKNPDARAKNEGIDDHEGFLDETDNVCSWMAKQTSSLLWICKQNKDVSSLVLLAKTIPFGTFDMNYSRWHPLLLKKELLLGTANPGKECHT